MFETSDTSPVDGVELDDFIRARARLEHAPTDVPAVVEMLKLADAEAWRRVDQTWRARMETDMRLARVIDEFVLDHVRMLRGEVDRGDDSEGEAPSTRAVDAPPVQQVVPSYLQHLSTPVPESAAAFPLTSPAPPLAPLPPAPPSPVRYAATQTAPLDLNLIRRLAAGGPTPFEGKTSPERLKELRDASTETEQTQPQSEHTADDGDETAMYQPSAAERASFRTLPFEPGLAKAVFPAMTVDQYAAFVAQLEGRGVSGDILLKHGVSTVQALQALHAEQQRRFEMDPALRARFEERKAHFLRFIKPGT